MSTSKRKVIQKPDASLVSTKVKKLPVANNEENKRTGVYKVENILLLESLFSRESNDILKEQEIINEIKINHEARETLDSKFGVIFTLAYTGKQNDSVVCRSTIKMLGVFEISGEPPLSDELFKQINAPAIIYPFVREHLHNICIKAGIANVFLPTVNFKP